MPIDSYCQIGYLAVGGWRMTRDDWLRQEIEKYRRKIDLYTAMIAEWEQELGNVGARTNGNQVAPDASAKKQGASVSDPASVVQGMVFFGKSQPEASKALLEMVGYPLTTLQIVQGIERGGVKVGGLTPAAKKTNLYTILQRSPDFGKVARDTWGIVGWPGVPKGKTSDDSESTTAGQSGAET